MIKAEDNRIARMVVSGLRNAREEQRMKWLEKHPGKEGRGRARRRGNVGEHRHANLSKGARGTLPLV